jgi:hypothetical protein
MWHDLPVGVVQNVSNVELYYPTYVRREMYAEVVEYDPWKLFVLRIIAIDPCFV